MEDYRRLSDQELVRMLKLYKIPHGPIVGSTRKLYEKKIYEYESQRTKLSPGTVSSYHYPEDFEGEAYGSRQDEDEDMEEVDYDNYYEESYSTTKTYGEADTAAIPVAKARTNFQEPQPSTSYSSDSVKAPTYHMRQRIRENILYPLAQEENIDSDSAYFHRDSNAYQSVSHYRSSAGASPDSAFSSSPVISSSFSSSTPVSSASPNFQWYSFPSEVEARQAIRPDQGPGAELRKSGRMVPLWVQFLLFIGFALFLAFLYYFMQVDDDNPFRLHP
ncbi:emerin [Vombatus ursinus]|uniref:LEM domain-containing protein n=1 Tax=Vombatus ursinus TaxID=29139 RepID=A0A4X2LTP0_VOMUR|nr:emerin [Vombatus ursinus]XP_027694716.1 emerin [Vombatus ursinus]